MNNSYKKILPVGFFVTVSVSFLAFNAAAQDLVVNDSVFKLKRPAGSGSSRNKGVYHAGKQLPTRRYKVSPAKESALLPASDPKKPVVLPANVVAAEQLGVTLWRLRPERSGDTGTRLLTMNGNSKLVAERVPLDTVFHKDEKVRISVESPRAGYLYIIDRELHKDESVGDPYMIFPTLKTRGGDNNAIAGKVIEVPAQTDDPFYFEITPSNENYAGELLTVIVSPVKIEGLKLTMDPIKLPASTVEKWEDLWERMSTSFELEAGKDMTYTEEEKEAGTGTRLLTQRSPAPQTLISVDATKGKAFLVSFPLKVSK